MNESEPIDASRIRQIISLIDLTNLNDDCDAAAISALCDDALTPAGPVAAICIWPEFIKTARHFLDNDTDIALATVVNFPSGDEPLLSVCAAIEKTIEDGANEIDYVLPYSELINGRSDSVVSTLHRIRENVPQHLTLKIILETGELKNQEQIRIASRIAIDHGADFIKTSTGKVPVNATLEAAGIMLEEIAVSGGAVGFKAAGGIKSVDEANAYLQLAETTLTTDWVRPTHFRFGASSLLQDALDKLNLQQSDHNGSGSDY